MARRGDWRPNNDKRALWRKYLRRHGFNEGGINREVQRTVRT